MKIVQILPVLLLCISTAFSQDLLVNINGDILKVKVAEISPEYVKYRNYNHLDGPLISIYRSEVHSIQYENGKKEVFHSEKSVPLKPQLDAPKPEKAANESNLKSSRATYSVPLQHNNYEVPDDELSIFGGATFPLGTYVEEYGFRGGASPGFIVGAEYTTYFTPNLGVLGSLSISNNRADMKGGYWINRSYFGYKLDGSWWNGWAMGGMKYKVPVASLQIFGLGLVGLNWMRPNGEMRFPEPAFYYDIDYGEGRIKDSRNFAFGIGTGVKIEKIAEFSIRYIRSNQAIELEEGDLPPINASLLFITAGIHF